VAIQDAGGRFQDRIHQNNAKEGRCGALAYDYYKDNPGSGRFEVQVDGRTLFGETAVAAMGYVPGDWEV
jgi:hypothetical protein